MSSSQEDLNKMSVKVLHLPVVIMFTKLQFAVRQSHKESFLSSDKKYSRLLLHQQARWEKSCTVIGYQKGKDGAILPTTPRWPMT